MKSHLLFSFCLVVFSESLINVLITDLDSLDCTQMETIQSFKQQLIYWKDLQNKDFNKEIGDLLQLKEQLLDKKELLLENQDDNSQFQTSFLQKGILTYEIKSLLHQISTSQEKLELCDIALKKINVLLLKLFDQKQQISEQPPQTLTDKFNMIILKEHQCNAKLQPASHDKQILSTFELDEEASDSIGYGYWLRSLSFYPESFRANTYFLSRVSQNQQYTDSELGDRKLVVHLSKKSLIFSTYDIKTLSVVKSAKIQISDPSKWFYVYYSYKGGKAIGFALQESKISRIEFHVEHFKLGEAWYTFGGNDLTTPGFNGQIAELTYGVGENQFIDDPKHFIQFYKKLHPQPSIQKQTVPFLTHLQQFPLQLTKSVEHEFIYEYALSGWFKMNKNTVQEIISVADQHSKYALSLYGGNMLSVATYSQDSKFRKFNMYDEQLDWHYVYMSYSYLKQTFNVFLWIDNKVLKVQEVSVLHTPTKKLEVKMGDHFNGWANHVNLYIGEGSHIENPSKLPSEFTMGVEFLKQEIHSYQLVHDPRVTSFILKDQHVVPHSLKIEKQMD